MALVRQNAHLIITYGEEDVQVQANARQAALTQAAWVVDVDTRGTLADLSDDVITISGGNQDLFGSSAPAPAAGATQVAIANVVFPSDCHRNPNTGIAVVQQIGTGGGGLLFLDFHSRCDGRADVTGATTASLLLLGDSVPLTLN
jgi:hypothetical protein